MALMSDAIPVADSTPFVCCFNNYLKSVNVLIKFYTDLEGRVELSPQSGTRDVTATNTLSAYGGVPSKPSDFKRAVEAGITNGTLTLTAPVIDELLLGSGMGNATLVAAPNTNPPGALSYRIFVEATGSSSTG